MKNEEKIIELLTEYISRTDTIEKEFKERDNSIEKGPKRNKYQTRRTYERNLQNI